VRDAERCECRLDKMRAGCESCEQEGGRVRVCECSMKEEVEGTDEEQAHRCIHT